MTKTNEPPEIWYFWDQEVKARPAEISKFQAELMKTSFTWAEKQKIPGLTIGFAQQRAALKIAGDTSVQARLNICGDLDVNGNMHECGVVFCPRCLLLRRRRQTAENLRLFAYQGNEKLAFMTVLVKVLPELTDAVEIQKKFTMTIRNAIMAKRSADPAWNEVSVKGYWEFDHLLDTDELGRNAKIALPPLGFPAVPTGKTCWLLHFHAIVGLREVSRDDFKAVIQGKNAPHPYQVDVQPFDTSKDVKLNIRNITRYSMKYRIEDDYKRTEPFDPEFEFDRQARSQRKWWPKEAVGSVANYLSQPRHGYRSQQFWIGPKSKSKKKTGVRTKGRWASRTSQAKPAPSPEIADMIAKLKKMGAVHVDGQAEKKVTDEHPVSLPQTWEFGED
ncbi:hypothetical protein [Pleomorphomonas sp. PLEO]|uniref:hypothetical protein n=1 Tax=Pleomorphomonas sp. PLEO TaxID=3239306 RepID=UPI00351E73D8